MNDNAIRYTLTLISTVTFAVTGTLLAQGAFGVLGTSVILAVQTGAGSILGFLSPSVVRGLKGGTV